MDEKEKTTEEVIKLIEDRLVEKYKQFRYCKFSSGIAMALSVVKQVEKELNDEE